MAAILRDSVAPTSNTASHDNHEKIHSWVTFSFLYEYGAPLGGPSPELHYDHLFSVAMGDRRFLCLLKQLSVATKKKKKLILVLFDFAEC